MNSYYLIVECAQRSSSDIVAGHRESPIPNSTVIGSRKKFK